jgi:hypothetical protein
MQKPKRNLIRFESVSDRNFELKYGYGYFKAEMGMRIEDSVFPNEKKIWRVSCREQSTFYSAKM